jgi:hypothetical protein
MARFRRNPYLVGPSGDYFEDEDISAEEYRGGVLAVTAKELSDVARGGRLPVTITREIDEGRFRGRSLPSGYDLADDMVKGRPVLRIYFRGEDTGKYGSTEEKAAEIISRMEAGTVTKRRMRRNPRERRR